MAAAHHRHHRSACHGVVSCHRSRFSGRDQQHYANTRAFSVEFASVSFADATIARLPGPIGLSPASRADQDSRSSAPPRSSSRLRDLLHPSSSRSGAQARHRQGDRRHRRRHRVTSLNREWSFRDRGDTSATTKLYFVGFAVSGVGVVLSVVARCGCPRYALDLQVPNVSLAAETSPTSSGLPNRQPADGVSSSGAVPPLPLFPDQLDNDDAALESTLTAGGIVEVLEEEMESRALRASPAWSHATAGTTPHPPAASCALHTASANRCLPAVNMHGDPRQTEFAAAP